MTPVVGGVVLAGGQARRMGGIDKSLLPLAGKPLIAHVISRLQPQCSAMAVNANGDPERFSAFGLPVIADGIPGFAGPLAGVLAGLDWAAGRKDQTHIATAAADTPFLPSNLVAALVGAADNRDDTVVIAKSNGRNHPVFALWPVALRDDLRNWMEKTDTYKVLAWVDRHRSLRVDFPDADIGGVAVDPFFNANTPDDLEIATRLAGETA